MLEDQITQLGTLRNANPRDAGFKLWRQNTLTVLQRIWPGDSTRSERFRRIAFSPSHGKPDGQTLRDWYTRGCTETTAYLHALIDMIDREGVPPAPDVMPEALPSSAGSREDDFPVLDLPAQGGGAGKTLVLGQSDSLADMAAMPGTDSGREAGAPAPPQLKVELKGPVTTPEAPLSVSMQRPASLKVDRAAAPKPAREPEQAAVIAPKLPPTTEPPIVTPSVPASVTPPAGTPVGKRPSRAAKARKTPAPKSKLKLKDMLGLGSLDAIKPAAQAPSPAPTSPAPAPVAASEPIAAPAPAAAPAPVVASAPPTQAAPSVPDAAPVPSAAEEHDGNEHDLPVMNDAEAAQATEDFLRMSPVLGLQGKPVQRTSDDTGFQDPDAIAVATLASDAGRLGVPEDAREKLRDALLELARQFEAKSPQWVALQKAITVSMEHPEVARRLMPVVLPWMHRAA